MFWNPGNSSDVITFWVDKCWCLENLLHIILSAQYMNTLILEHHKICIFYLLLTGDRCHCCTFIRKKQSHEIFTYWYFLFILRTQISVTKIVFNKSRRFQIVYFDQKLNFENVTQVQYFLYCTWVGGRKGM